MKEETKADEAKVEVVLSFVEEVPPNSGSQGAISIPVKEGYLMLTIFDKKILQRIHWKIRFDVAVGTEGVIEDSQGKLGGV